MQQLPHRLVNLEIIIFNLDKSFPQFFLSLYLEVQPILKCLPPSTPQKQCMKPHPHPLPTPLMQQYLQCIYYDKSFKLRDCMNEIIHKWFYLLQSSSRRSTSGFLVCPWRVCSTAGRTSLTSSWSWSILGYMKISESISKVYSYEYDYYLS